jgi:hypothetical protein
VAPPVNEAGNGENKPQPKYREKPVNSIFLCLSPGILMKRNIPTAALSVMPNCGHAVNIEDPDGFNALVGSFLTWVASGCWTTRDPRAMTPR